MLLSRWISLFIFVIVLLFMLKENGKLKGKFAKCGVLLAEGMVGGLIIDSIGINAGFYYFPRHPIYSPSYFLIVLPCWGVFGLLTNYLWDKLGREKFTLGLVLTTPLLFAFYEGLNLLTNSWTYTVSPYTVALGWLPLVLAFTGCHRRRQVVSKVKALELSFNQPKLAPQLIKHSLVLARILLTFLMFPLLVVSLLRLFTEFGECASKTEYAKYLLMVK